MPRHTVIGLELTLAETGLSPSILNLDAYKDYDLFGKSKFQVIAGISGAAFKRAVFLARVSLHHFIGDIRPRGMPDKNIFRSFPQRKRLFHLET